MANGIIDYKNYMANDYKVYVDVNEDRFSDGSLIPNSFTWKDGRCYEIDRIIDIRPAASLKAGGVGIRYIVRVRDKEIYMFLEEDGDKEKWFIELQK